MEFLRSRFGRVPPLPFLLLALVGVLIACSSCSTMHQKKLPETPAIDTVDLNQELAERDAAILRLEKDNHQQDLLLLQKDALINQMEGRLLTQQIALDDAINEVVRAKAKQRSLETRAEAASEMAEAEVALKSFRDDVADPESPELAQAEQLLKMGVQEFEKQNFGGALYLASHAKTQIGIGMLRQSQEDPAYQVDGETAFAASLALKLKSRSNLREGPGLEFKVLVTLDEGTTVTAYSAKGAWLRVKGEEGSSGWIYRSLVNTD